MEPNTQLDLLQQLGQILLGPPPLSQRLAAALRQLRAALQLEVVRVVVLDEREPWSLSAPATIPAAWPAAYTAQLLRSRSATQSGSATAPAAPLRFDLPGGRTYHGWPIRWRQRLYGALETVAAAGDGGAELVELLGALLPLFAAAIAQPAPPPEQVPALVPRDQQRMDALAAQLQAPMLLQPLLAALLQWSLEISSAARGSIHLAEANGHGLHLLAFELPGQAASNGHGTALTLSARNNDLAKIALANGCAMVRTVDREVQFAAPIQHDGQLLGAVTLEGAGLEPQALGFVQRLADIAGPALVRARFYQQLVDTRSHLQHVFDDLPTGLALTDGDGTLLRANPAWWRLWGIDAADVGAIKLVPWDILPRILARLPDPLAFSDLFTRGMTTPNEADITLQEPWQELRLIFMPARDTLGTTDGFLLALDDITREREGDRLKTEFVSVVSHELRTPLTSILGYTELLLARDFEPAERKEFIHTVHKAADHLANLVEDLLNVSRLDSGKINLERWVMALPKLVRELVAQLNKELDVERHRLLLDVADTLPPIYADRDRVRQILSNLLSNAIKYSPEGGEVILHASVLHRPPPNAPSLPHEPSLLISVRDHGIGIPQAELGRIFERFYRVDNSNTRRIGGTGLGLAITRALVELHGGRIWADSTPGDGSTFYVTLPIATEMLRTRR